MKTATPLVIAALGLAALAGCGASPDKGDESTGTDIGPVATSTSAEVASAPPQEAAASQAAPTDPAAKPGEQAAAAEPDPKPEPAPTEKPKALAVAPAAPATIAPEAKKVAMGRPASFAQCAICHSDKAGQKSGFGPNLFGVAGTKSGELGGYAFSPAMKNAGIVWDRDTLNKFIEAPQSVVPGTTMAFGGVKDEAKRKAIVDYVLLLK